MSVRHTETPDAVRQPGDGFAVRQICQKVAFLFGDVPVVDGRVAELFPEEICVDPVGERAVPFACFPAEKLEPFAVIDSGFQCFGSAVKDGIPIVVDGGIGRLTALFGIVRENAGIGFLLKFPRTSAAASGQPESGEACEKFRGDGIGSFPVKFVIHAEQKHAVPFGSGKGESVTAPVVAAYEVAADAVSV